jgi:polysaccharide biosynthesis protein PslG
MALPQFGYPISEEIAETLEDGKSYTVQYFERARFEWHPENRPPYDILLGQFGRRILGNR